jgi:hypothetical protein
MNEKHVLTVLDLSTEKRFYDMRLIILQSYRPVFRIRIGYMWIRIQHFDECRSGPSADPDSGQIWFKFAEGKQNEIFVSHLLLFTLNIFRPNFFLKYDCMENTYKKNLVFRLNFSSFLGADFPPSGSALRIRIRIANADPGAHLMRIQCRSGFKTLLRTMFHGRDDSTLTVPVAHEVGVRDEPTL